MLSLSVANITIYIMVFTRMAGMVLLNPVFSRRNFPARARVALVVALTILLAPTVDPSPMDGTQSIELLAAMLQEFFIGVVCAYVFQIFYYMLYFAGDLMDMQFGLSMARVFDPGTSIQSTVSGNFLTLMFILYFFVTDSHLLLIRVFAASYQIVPVAGALILGEIAPFMVRLFISTFSLATRLIAPFVAVEFIIEVCMGILMKLIPQIHVFVLNIQLKIMFGLGMLFLFSQPISNFIDQYLEETILYIQKALQVLIS